MARPKGGGGDARQKLIEAAGRGFRVGGYGGIGVDGLAKEAGLTSGAFYAHFSSKADAFAIAIIEGMQFLRRGVEAFQSQYGKEWLTPFVDFYLGDRMAVNLNDACALPTFTADVARSEDATRKAYSDEFALIVKTVAGGFDEENSEVRALNLLAILSGAAGIARAITDGKMRTALIDAAKAAAKAV